MILFAARFTGYGFEMARTHKKVRYPLKSKLEGATDNASLAAEGAQGHRRTMETRILFHLNTGGVMRFSELERAIPAVTQKMLIQQLRELERDGMIERRAHPEVPPKVDYRLTQWGQDLCPALAALRAWAALKHLPMVNGLPDLDL